MANLTAEQILHFAMHLIFTKEITEQEELLAERIFAAGASILTIPRARPLVAASVNFRQLLKHGPDLPIATGAWSECWHTIEADAEERSCVRVFCNARVQPVSPGEGDRMSVDFMFVINALSEKIIAGCIVYDEPRKIVSSPITLRMSALTDDMLKVAQIARAKKLLTD